MPAPERLKLMKSSPKLGATALFLARGVAYTVDDALASALFRGSLDGAIEETLRLTAAEERAAEEGLEADGKALQASADRFRYDHDLISAGETEKWLEDRRMTMEDFSGWLHGRLCISGRDALKPATAPDDFPHLLRVHLWMSGGMEELETQLSRRIAAGFEVAEREETLSTEPVMQRFLERHRLDERSLSGWLAALGRERSWLAETVRIEAAFDRLSSLAIAGDARARKLALMELSMARIEMETLELDSEAAAREAFLCVRNDGSSLSEVAVETGFRAERAEVWIDTLDDTLGSRLLNAAEGEVIGPIEHDGGFRVYQVLRKLKASLTEPAVTSRIDKLIVDELFAGICAHHIQARDFARTET